MGKFDEKYICQQYEEGLSSITIGRMVGASDAGIRKILKRNNVKLRTRYAHVLLKNPMQGKTHSDTTKQKLSKLTKKQFSNPEARQLASHKQIEFMKNNPNRQQRSRLEFLVEGVLNEIGINYKSPHPIQDLKTGRFRALADIYLVDYNTVIEVNGTYWHSDSRFYPDGPVTESQKHVEIKYLEKVKFYKELGLKLIELWEYDIKNSNIEELIRSKLNGL